MPTLHIRNVPNDLYANLKEFAVSKNRSLTAEVVMLLGEAVEDRKRRNRTKSILASLRRRRFVPPADAPGSLTLLRRNR